MTEQSKFAGALGRLKRPVTEIPEQGIEKGPPVKQTTAPTSPASQGRRVGKRSNPEFSPTTFFVRKQTKRKVAQVLLEEENSDRDLSDLVEELLAKWLSEHSHV